MERMQTQTLIDRPIGCTRASFLRLLQLPLVYSTLPAFAQDGSRESISAPTLSLDLKRIASALSRMVDDGRTAGVSVLIWKDGREAWFGSAGFADREAGRPMTRDTIAQIYSMTKPVDGRGADAVMGAGQIRAR